MQPTVLQRFSSGVGAAAGIAVNAQPYSAQTLRALAIAIRELQPSAIFITGDITNFGDEESFEFAAREIEKLRAETSNARVLAIPGNHDTLTERAAAIEKDKRAGAWLVRRLGLFNPEVGILRRMARRVAGKEPETIIRLALHRQLTANPKLPFLAAYGTHIAPSYGIVDPAEPIPIDMPWGRAFVFLFNSNVQDTFMANEGRIGAQGYNDLHDGLTRRDRADELRASLKIALLHHHPISAPQGLDPAIERLYNWMEDGPLLLQYLNREGFSLVLHGHQHVPFVCSVNYRDTEEAPLHIVAAGSATQAGEKASFNVIDILNPFQMRVRRYDYQLTSFVQAPEPSPRRLSIRAPSSIRLTPANEPEIAEDGALRNLILATEEDAANEFELLEHRVTITPNQRYVADYRRKGIVRSKDGEDGPLFVITGSPAMEWNDMNLAATTDGGKKAYIVLILDSPTRKVLRVLPRPVKLKVGETFDVTLHFEWQATPAEPNDFDGFNFMNMRYPIGKFVYRVEYPWKAAQVCLLEYVLQKRINTECVTPPEDIDAKGQRLTIEITKPKPVVYLMFFGDKVRHQFWTA